MRLRDVVAGLDGADDAGGVRRHAALPRRAAGPSAHGIDWSVEVDGAVDGIGDDERAELLRW